MLKAAVSGVCCIAMAGVAGRAAAQVFQPGDVYLISSSLPRTGGGAEAGVVRIQPGGYAVTRVYTGTLALGGRATYDPFRQRIIFLSVPSSFLLLAADGTTSSLLYTGNGAEYPAAAGDGRVYFVRNASSGAGLAMVDASGTTFDILNETGTAIAVTTTITYALFWDTTTQSLLLGQARAGGANGLERITLTSNGRQVVSRTQSSFANGTGSEVITGFSAGPGGSVFIKLDDNTNNTDTRMATVDVATLAVSGFATSGYFGVAGEVAGAYMPTVGAAIVLDTLSDNLRVFAPGTVGAGTIVATAGVSSTGGSGESAQFVIVSAPSPRCGSADFNCDGDIGTDSDISAFFTCLSGACPAAPCTNSADFNGDGDIGTDSDIEAFFRVLAGGSC